MEGCIVSIHIASVAGAPMTAITTAHLMPGRGIEGDRFYASRGKDAASDGTTCDVTFVEQEALEALKGGEPRTDSGDTARRNIVIHGGSLQQLIGRTFRIGDVVLRGLAPHEFCASEDTQQATSCMALHQADLRVQILTEGTISVERLQSEFEASFHFVQDVHGQRRFSTFPLKETVRYLHALWGLCMQRPPPDTNVRSPGPFCMTSDAYEWGALVSGRTHSGSSPASIYFTPIKRLHPSF